uniref:Uncharacterized protein n=1 Tax=Rhizophora mucronata TaxID=61149 RepID=A0A2P2K7Y2_RHIMU
MQCVKLPDMIFPKYTGTIWIIQALSCGP